MRRGVAGEVSVWARGHRVDQLTSRFALFGSQGFFRFIRSVLLVSDASTGGCKGLSPKSVVVILKPKIYKFIIHTKLHYIQVSQIYIIFKLHKYWRAPCDCRLPTPHTWLCWLCIYSYRAYIMRRNKLLKSLHPQRRSSQPSGCNL